MSDEETKPAFYLEELHNPGVYLEDLYIHVILEAVIIIQSVLGNLLILISIGKFPSLRNRSNVLIANLAVADLLVGVILIPLDMVGILWQELSANEWFCLVELSVYTCLLGASVLNSFVISLERFTVICCPLWYERRFKARLLHILVATMWIVAVTVACIPLFGFRRTMPLPAACSSDYIYKLEYKTLLSLISIPTIVATCIMYGCVMRTAISQLKKTMSSVENRKLRKYAKRTWLMLITFAVFVMCWAPYVALVTLAIFKDYKHLLRIRQWTTLLGLFNSGMNWIIYGLMNRRFRRAFKYILTCRCNVNFSRLSATDSFVNPTYHRTTRLKRQRRIRRKRMQSDTSKLLKTSEKYETNSVPT